MPDENVIPIRPKKGAPGGIRPRLILALGVLLVVFVVFKQFFVYVRPYEFGIKEVKIGILSKRGVQEKVYNPGWAFQMPFGMEVIHRFPSDIQILDLTSSNEEKSHVEQSGFLRKAGVRVDKAARIQTSDGFYVDVDASILYRIKDPYKVITTLGPGNLFIESGIVPKAEPVLKQALGTMNTEDFYNSLLRYERVKEAKKLLQEEVEAKGLLVEQVLIRYFVYSPEIQKNIEEKKLKDQLVFKNIAEKKAATEEAELKKIAQEGEATVTVKLQGGKAYEVTRAAERDLYVRKKRAEGDLLVQLAEAHKTELRNNAYQGAGSSKMVGLKMAEALDGLDLIVLPSDGEGGFNPLDLGKTLKMFGAEGGAQ